MKNDVERCRAGKAINLAAAEVCARMTGATRHDYLHTVYFDFPGDVLESIVISRRDGNWRAGEWSPSTVIADAWDLLSALEGDSRHWFEVASLGIRAGQPRRYACAIEWLDVDQDRAHSIPKSVRVEAETAALAITRAFLLCEGVHEIEIMEQEQ